MGYESATVLSILPSFVKLFRAEYPDIDISVFQEAESYIALLGLVAAGLGFTIVTSSAEQFFADDIAYRPLANPRVTVDYGLAFRHNNSIAAAEPLRVVSKHLTRIFD